MNEDEAAQVMLPAEIAALEAEREVTTAPVTAEGMRTTILRAISDPGAFVSLIPGEYVDNWSARAVVAALAGDPGDLPARMAEAIHATSLCEEFNPVGCGGACSQAAAAAMSVRWEDAAQLAGENVQLRAERDHAVGQVSALRDHGTRWQTEHGRANTAEAEVDRLQKERAAWRSMAGVEEVEAERDDYLNRLRTVDGAYSRLDAERREAEGARDRWKARAEAAEAQVAALRTELREWASVLLRGGGTVVPADIAWKLRQIAGAESDDANV